MRFAAVGIVIAVLIFLISGGHVLFLPLLFLLPFGGMLGHRQRYAHVRYRGGRGY